MADKTIGRPFPQALTFFKGRFYLNFATYLFRRLAIGATLFILLIYLFTNRELGTDYLGSLSTLYSVKENLPYTILITAGVVMMFLGISLFFMTLVKSNKIAGPFYRLERLFEEVEKGDLSVVVNFRKDDAINLIVDESNMALDTINDSFTSVHDASAQLREALKALEVNPESTNIEDLRSRLAKLKEANGRLKIEGDAVK
jgi:methyl-accepting chemotaxis protein